MERPPEAVFAYVTDPRRRAHWQTRLTEVRELPALVTAGAAWVEVDSRTGSYRVTVERHDPPVIHQERIESRAGTFRVP